KADQCGFELRVFIEMGIMALVAVDFDKGGVSAGGKQSARQAAPFLGRITPIAGEREHAMARRRARESVGEIAAEIRAQVEGVGCARQVEVGICVEAIDESVVLR